MVSGLMGLSMVTCFCPFQKRVSLPMGHCRGLRGAPRYTSQSGSASSARSSSTEDHHFRFQAGATQPGDTVSPPKDGKLHHTSASITAAPKGSVRTRDLIRYTFHRGATVAHCWQIGLAAFIIQQSFGPQWHAMEISEICTCCLC